MIDRTSLEQKPASSAKQGETELRRRRAGEGQGSIGSPAVSLSLDDDVKRFQR